MPDLDDLLRSHHELRAALRLAINEIQRLQPSDSDCTLIDDLRAIGAAARTIAHAFSHPAFPPEAARAGAWVLTDLVWRRAAHQGNGSPNADF